MKDLQYPIASACRDVSRRLQAEREAQPTPLPPLRRGTFTNTGLDTLARAFQQVAEEWTKANGDTQTYDDLWAG